MQLHNVRTFLLQLPPTPISNPCNCFESTFLLNTSLVQPFLEWFAMDWKYIYLYCYSTCKKPECSFKMKTEWYYSFFSFFLCFLIGFLLCLEGKSKVERIIWLGMEQPLLTFLISTINSKPVTLAFFHLLGTYQSLSNLDSLGMLFTLPEKFHHLSLC